MLPDHHAVLFTDAPEQVRHEVATALAVDHEVVHLITESFTIADARQVIEIANRTPLQHSRIAIIIETGTILHEAAQAMLKILEEPPLTARFILFLPANTALPPTVHSRVYEVSSSAKIADYAPVFKKFLAAPLPERLSLVAEFVTLAKDKEPRLWQNLTESLDRYVAETSFPIERLSYFHDCRSWLSAPGGSKKMIWEELAFLLPEGSIRK